MSTATATPRCGGTRWCDGKASRTCSRCRLPLCSGHWTGTQCLKGGGHKDDVASAPAKPAPPPRPKTPGASTWAGHGPALPATTTTKEPTKERPMPKKSSPELNEKIAAALRAGRNTTNDGGKPGNPPCACGEHSMQIKQIEFIADTGAVLKTFGPCAACEAAADKGLAAQEAGR